MSDDTFEFVPVVEVTADEPFDPDQLSTSGFPPPVSRPSSETEVSADDASSSDCELNDGGPRLRHPENPDKNYDWVVYDDVVADSSYCSES